MYLCAQNINFAYFQRKINAQYYGVHSNNNTNVTRFSLSPLYRDTTGDRDEKKKK